MKIKISSHAAKTYFSRRACCASVFFFRSLLSVLVFNQIIIIFFFSLVKEDNWSHEKRIEEFKNFHRGVPKPSSAKRWMAQTKWENIVRVIITCLMCTQNYSEFTPNCTHEITSCRLSRTMTRDRLFTFPYKYYSKICQK